MLSRQQLLVCLGMSWCLTLGGCAGDTDGDGLSDQIEGQGDSDNDGFPDFQDQDADNDGIFDNIEGQSDTDEDGTPDFQDQDDDQDGIPTALEGTDDPEGDGVPSYLDNDSDGDTILDEEESSVDSDSDGLPNFLDVDSDSDGILDSIEAGDADLSTASLDSDGDGAPNFRDPDSDNDTLLDEDEDLNLNGSLDPGESSPALQDTDADGVLDIVEVVAGADPQDPNSQIPPGDFFFVLPFFGPEQNGVLDFSSDLRQADIFFSVDTTGSFQQEIDAIATSLSDIQTQIRAQVPDVAFGVGSFEDFPIDPFGLSSDRPFQLLQRVTTDDASVLAAVQSLGPAAGGLDTPEAGYEALFQWSTGVGLPAFATPPFDPNVGFDAALGHGQVGGVGFREGSLPIVLQVTDAASHTDYPVAFGSHGRDNALFALGAISARVIGIDSLENVGTPFDPRLELEDLALSTNALIPPNGGQCFTGVGGSPRTPNVATGLCPLVFDVNPDGTGLGDLIIQAIIDLVSLGTLYVSGRAVGDPQQLPNIDTGRFIKSISPLAPAPGSATIDGDIFRDVPSGSQVFFTLTARNDFVPENEAIQLFTVDIEVLGDLVTVLDVRRVFVIVPPAAPPIQ